MWPSHGYQSNSWAGFILGWLLLLLLLGVVTRALVAIVIPLLPFIGLGLLVLTALTIAINRQRDGW